VNSVLFGNCFQAPLSSDFCWRRGNELARLSKHHVAIIREEWKTETLLVAEDDNEF